MGEDEPDTKPRQIRIAQGLWETYDAICKRRGITRAEAVNNHIRGDILRHGTPEEVAVLARVDAELEERRSRQRPGLRARRPELPIEPEVTAPPVLKLASEPPEPEEINTTECATCGTLLDPDGSCFVCR